MGKKVVARVEIDEELWRWVKAQALLKNMPVGELVEKVFASWKVEVEAFERIHIGGRKGDAE